MGVQGEKMIGPYRLSAPLGQGGMGQVYRAVHVDSGRLVALKTVRTVRRGLIDGIRREIRALARLRHPGVVRIVDEGVHEGVPWYAMQIVDGQPLSLVFTDRDQLRSTEPLVPETASGHGGDPSPPNISWWTETIAETEAATSRSVQGVEPAERRPMPAKGSDRRILALNVVAQLCAPLAYLHGEGIVHRDLKPLNVLLDANDRPIIVDFGLVAQFHGSVGREALTMHTGLAGTLPYIAPEAIRGDPLDARADLYSLGCILYELLTGTVPFRAEKPAEVMRMHLENPVVPPSTLAPDVSAELDELVLRLLAKEPQYRIGYATDVVRALAMLNTQVDLATGGPEPQTYLYRPRLIGRSGPLALLCNHLDSLRAGRGGAIMVSGESGVGKTRLMLELGRQAALKHVLVLAGECRDGDDRMLQCLRRPLQTIADHCREQGAAATERLIGSRGRVLERYEPSLATLPGQERFPEPRTLPVDAARSRLLASLAEILAAMAADQPTLLILDDLQWADDLALAFLEYWIRAGMLDTTPLLVVGAFRLEQMTERLASLLDRGRVARLRLDRLDSSSVEQIVGAMLAVEPPPRDLVRHLVDLSEGNPFFVAEYLRVAVDDGLLRRNSAGRWQAAEIRDGLGGGDHYDQLELPNTLRKVIRRRLEGLTPAAEELVAISSVVGRETSAELLLATDLFPERELLADARRELVARQVMDESVDDTLRFAHDMLREVAYEGLEAHRRRDLHRTVATAFETCQTADLAPVFPQLAHHWCEARDPDKAGLFLIRAGEQALASGAYGSAAGHLQRLLDTAELRGWQIPSRSRAERLLGEALLNTGKLVESRQALECAVSLDGVPVPRSPVGRMGRIARHGLGQLVTRGRRWTARPGTTARSRGAAPDLHKEATMAYPLLVKLYWFGNTPLHLVDACLTSLATAERRGPSPELAESLGMTGVMLGLVPAPKLAVHYLEEARRAASQLGDPFLQARVDILRCTFWMGRGDWPAVEKTVGAAIDCFQELGVWRSWSEGACLHSTLLHHLARYPQRLEIGSEVLKRARRTGDVQAIAWGLLDQIETLLPMNRLNDADALLRELRPLTDRNIGLDERIWSFATLARFHLQQGDLSAALAAADQGLTWASKTRPRTFYTMEGYAALANVLLTGWAKAAPATESELRRKARKACSKLRAFGKIMPFARPRALIATGIEAWLSGRPRRSRQTLRRAIESASSLRMPYDEALAHLELARRLSAERSMREHHLNRARRLFDSAGAVSGLADVQRLL